MNNMAIELHNAINRLLRDYKNVYEHVKSKNDWKNPFRELISKDIPELLRNVANISSPYQIVGSYGKGRWTAVPWIAVFDSRITTSAQKGVYIVYLLNKDTSGRDSSAAPPRLSHALAWNGRGVCSANRDG